MWEIVQTYLSSNFEVHVQSNLSLSINSFFHYNYYCLSLRWRGCGQKFGFMPIRRLRITHVRTLALIVGADPAAIRRSEYPTKVTIHESHHFSPHRLPPILTLDTMLPTSLPNSAYYSWIIAFLLGAAVLYYYTTKTDIPKIRGIPEIPGALPMFSISLLESPS